VEPPAFLAVVGPTASGKTTLSIPVAEALKGEIISVDSRQVYRGMDVGTAKATATERLRVPHHGLDLVDPDESYSAGRFARDARRWVSEIRTRGHVPVLVGGTGFFLRALMDPIFQEPMMDRERVRALRHHLSGYTTSALAEWVRALDPERADVAMAGGAHRMIRTLEVTLLTGRPLSWWHREAPAEQGGLEGPIFVLELPTKALDRRIDERARRMITGGGFAREVSALLDRGYAPDDPGFTAVGYKEMVRHLRGECPPEEVEEALRRGTRRYARRQRTWFRNQLPAGGVHRLDATRPLDELVDSVVAAWEHARAGDGKGGTNQ
jgi:tRNA dimethylallyltransferase